MKTTNPSALLSLIVIAWATLPATAEAVLRATGGAASFDASGPAGLKIQGKTSDVSVSETQGNVRVNVALANLDTGIDLRNHHMRDKYLEVQKYPEAVLVVEKASLRVPEDGKDSSASANGTMTIHGQTKPVTFTYKAHRDHDAVDVSGSAHIDIREFGIVVPSYLGITVKPGVDVAAHFVAHDV